MGVQAGVMSVWLIDSGREFRFGEGSVITARGTDNWRYQGFAVVFVLRMILHLAVITMDGCILCRIGLSLGRNQNAYVRSCLLPLL